ncbi:hypothetical protein GCM10023093_17330 [Nemorincola caseinilytica]|uniref:histidine kinase n=1 Tax=Nemorincola caseinilytica TaxID=2054315 RepID=A0ABP8NDN2_9BACT
MDNKSAILQQPSPFRIVLLYIIIGSLYIYYSDQVIRLFSGNAATLSSLQTKKGVAFVLITAGLLFLVVNVYRKKMMHDHELYQDEVKLSEEKYWTLFNESPISMWIYDVNTLRFLLVNETACTKYGYSREEFYHMTVDAIRPAQDMPRFHSSLKDARSSGKIVWHKPFRHITRNGEVRIVKIKSSAIIFEGSDSRLVTVMDVTDEVNAQVELKEANERLSAASQIAMLGYWDRDLVADTIYWSPELYKIFELCPETFDLTIDNIISRFHPDHRDTFGANLLELFKNGGLVSFEHRILVGDGREKWILQRLKLIKNEEGIPVKLEGISLDITERKVAQQALHESNERFGMVTRAAVEAIIDWDAVNGGLFVSDGFRDLFGHNIRTGDASLWLRYIHPVDRERVVCALKKALSTKTQDNFYVEFRFLKADGQIAYVQHRGIFVRDRNGRVVRAVGAMIDVTATVHKMQHIEQQNEKLREITWVQSHIVRGPLATLMGLTTMLKDNDLDPAEIREVLDGIATCADRLDGVIHDIVKKAEAATEYAA